MLVLKEAVGVTVGMYLVEPFISLTTSTKSKSCFQAAQYQFSCNTKHLTFAFKFISKEHFDFVKYEEKIYGECMEYTRIPFDRIQKGRAALFHILLDKVNSYKTRKIESIFGGTYLHTLTCTMCLDTCKKEVLLFKTRTKVNKEYCIGKQ